MQASKEVWGTIFGTISTRRKFLDKRLELAKHEWARLKANDSLECRNCHTAVAMDFTKQTQRAAEIHSRFLVTRSEEHTSELQSLMRTSYAVFCLKTKKQVTKKTTKAQRRNTNRKN